MPIYYVYCQTSLGKKLLTIDEDLLKQLINESNDYHKNMIKYSRTIYKYLIKRTVNINALKQYYNGDKFYLEIHN